VAVLGIRSVSDVLSRRDRQAGAALRRTVARSPALVRAARIIAGAMSPGFRTVVVGLVATRRTRGTGLVALAASVASALIAKVLRDRLGRARPGARTEAGFPSRHSAASVAIAVVVSERHPMAGQVLGVAAIVGMAARVATAEHEPGDVLCGAAVGGAVATAIARAAFRRPSWMP
jgi:membrane-associated phospholipid phosphatase